MVARVLEGRGTRAAEQPQAGSTTPGFRASAARPTTMPNNAKHYLIEAMKVIVMGSPQQTVTGQNNKEEGKSLFAAQYPQYSHNKRMDIIGLMTTTLAKAGSPTTFQQLQIDCDPVSSVLPIRLM